MNIADIDLDIFLDDVCSLDRRPRAPSTTRPWTGEQLRRFLEDQCGLKRALSSSRPKGRFVVHHDEAFPILNVLSQNGAVPLTLTHIDAHSDLGTGVGDLSWKDIGGRLLALTPKERAAAIPHHGMERISAANYLSYALACRWLRMLTYVHHAHSGDDLMPFFFRDFDPACGIMELRYVPRVHDVRSREELLALPHILEPPIPFQKVPVEAYRAAELFEYVILCQSPGYTPAEADTLIPIFQDYVDFGDVRAQGFPGSGSLPSGKGEAQ
ncbi:hypothetical protein FJV80_25370 [Mesorhizobium sp. WSM4310]|uniref:UPF0489 family protein n=1 Tax=unclassified Mesorhizobium TaxID=325217 RepID=UPI000BB05728|nr:MULTISPECIES: UPF0489 family protein [unclassified Mesorhizobium]PBC19308.1 hypothetical protein CK226_29705 [Mesorhizobium sp. WSM4311]TRC77689.1 hypothetical protein FJV80_25370 [Mesorhizobium sp. WSM4310]TRC78082.1 hypothetical protein FJV81_11025 [Mesorhizobium sp. WSM4315]TRD00255.1 hypothetical protein FJV82_21780 [Mesorhizobium sp. WSM4305]